MSSLIDKGWETVLGVTSVYGNGRTQVPSRVRKILQIEDGDLVAWCVDSYGKIYVVKQPRKVSGSFAHKVEQGIKK